MTYELLDADYRRSLDLLRRYLAPSVAAGTSGDHRTRHRGSGQEFQDHRPYVPGDDLRRVDWMAYARSGEPVIKLFSWQDKVEHALLFAGLAILGIAGWPRRAGVLAAGLLAYGAAMEVAQSTTAYRVGDPLDWLADAVGLLILLPFVLRRKTGGR